MQPTKHPEDQSDAPDQADRPPRRPTWAERFFGLAGQRTDSDQDDERRKKFAAAGAGMELAAGIGIFAGLGYLGDWYFGTLPWLTLVGALLGMAAGMYQLIKTIGRNG